MKSKLKMTGDLFPDKSYAEKKLITVSMAKELMEKNIDNRPPRPNTTDRYARLMKNEKWMTNGETIKVDWDGNLLDGQHRLAAIIRSGVPIQCWVIYGLDPKVFITLDAGVKRNGSDALAIKGYTSTVALAAILGLLLSIEKLNTTGGDYLRNLNSDDIVDSLNRFKNVEHSVNYSRNRPQKHLLTGSVVGTLHYLFSQKDAELAESFFYKLFTGTMLPPQSPILLLRNMLEEIARRPGYRLSRVYLLAYTIQAWNAVRENKVLEKITYTTSGPTPDKFPVII